MSRIAIIAPTGNSQIDQVLAGVIGQLNETGTFEPIEEFRQIPLLSAMTPEVMAEIANQSGATPGIIEIVVDDQHLAGFKATMAHQLMNRWANAYDIALERVPAGLARAAVNGEIAKVRAGCTAVIDKSGQAPQTIQLSKAFDNVLGQPRYEEGDDEDYGGTEVLSVSIHPGYLLKCTDTPWEMTSQAIAQDSLSDEITSPDIATPAATGSLVKTMQIYGDGHAMAAALNQMPAELSQLVSGVDPVRIAPVQWHIERLCDAHVDEDDGAQSAPEAPSAT